MNAPTGIYNPNALNAAITAYFATKDALALLQGGSYQWMDAAERHADAAAALRRLLAEAAPHFGLPPSDTDGAYTAHLRHMNPDWRSAPPVGLV